MDPAYKTAMNWATKTLRRMTREKTHKRRKRRIGTVRLHLQLYGLLRNTL